MVFETAACVGGFDLLGDRAGGDRPQRGHRLHRGEREVEPGHRRRLRPGHLGQEPGQLPGVRRGPAVPLGEHLGGQFGADPGPLLRRHRRVLRPPVHGVPRLVPDGQPFPPCRVALHHPVRRTQLRRGQRGRRGPAGVDDVGLDAVGVGVDALPEQVPHLLLGDRPGRAQAFEAAADPGARGFALRGVVVAQRGCIRVRWSPTPRPAGSGTCTRPRRSACADPSQHGSLPAVMLM